MSQFFFPVLPPGQVVVKVRIVEPLVWSAEHVMRTSLALIAMHCKQETLNTFLTSPRQSVCWPVKLHLATSARWARQLGQHPSISYFLTGRLEIWKIFTGISLSLVHCATTVKEYNEMKWIRFNQPLRPHQAKPSLVYRYNFINYYTLSKNKYSFHKCQSDFIPPN